MTKNLTISTLIEKLLELKNKHGDLPIWILNSDGNPEELEFYDVCFLPARTNSYIKRPDRIFVGP